MNTLTVRAFDNYDDQSVDIAMFSSDIGRTLYNDKRECYVTDDFEYFTELIEEYKVEYGNDVEIEYEYWLNGRVSDASSLEEITLLIA